MSDDMFDWEVQPPKFEIHVLAGVYVMSCDNEQRPITTCGFIESDDGELHLPYTQLADDKFAAQVAVKLFRELIPVDLRTLDIVPYGFFDPLGADKDESMAQRVVSIFYKTRVHPGTPVHPDLRFLTHEELEIARPRIRRSHYEAYRTGVGG
jgi:hypothetical protein